jgi:hypothetical protein
MSKPIFTTIRQFILSAILRASPPRPKELTAPEPQRRDLTPENDTWMFDAPRNLAAHKADFGRAMSQLSGQLASVRDLLSRISPTAPILVEAYQGSQHCAIWSDTVLFDGGPAPIEIWGEGLVSEDTGFLFDETDMAGGDERADDLFGGYSGQIPALAS